MAVRAVNSADRVFLYAKNASVSMTMLLEFRLRRIGVDVRRIPSGGTEMLEGLAAAGKGDLVILFGFSKVSREGRVILEHAKTAGYRTLLFTGRLHPAAGPRADINLVVFRGEDNEYHSMSAAAAVADALVIAVSDARGSGAAQALNGVKTLKERYGKEL